MSEKIQERKNRTLKMAENLTIASQVAKQSMSNLKMLKG